MSKALISAASKHGSTAEIAERIGERLSESGFDVTLSEPDSVGSPEEFDLVVLGSAVYAGQWLEPAKQLASRMAAATPRPAVWLFSSGPIGDPPKPEEDPVDVAEIAEATGARGHQVFAGKLDRSELGFAEKAIVVALRAPEGDFRDWTAIDAWAKEIAQFE